MQTDEDRRTALAIRLNMMDVHESLGEFRRKERIETVLAWLGVIGIMVISLSVYWSTK